MTILGKTLAILQLVLSLFVGWLILLTYVTRTNWHNAYLELDKQVKASRADANVYRTDAEEAKGTNKKLADEITALKEKMKSNEELAAVQAQQLNQQLEAERQKNKIVTADETATTGEIGRRQTETGNMTALMTALQDKLKTKEKEAEDSRAAMVEAQIAASSERERNNNLLNQVEKLTKEVQKMQQTGPAGALAAHKNPPAEDVEGVVKATDPQSGYVTITIGSDQGIHKGNTLDVYRLRPDAVYLGVIEILAVHANEAVGKPIMRMRGQIQAGDRVSSTIVSRR